MTDKLSDEQSKQIARSELQEARRKKQTSDLKSVNTALIKEVEHLERKLDLVLDIRNAPAEPYVLKYPKKKGKHPKTVTVSLASDLHIEERVDLQKTNGLNEHSLEISEEKMYKYWRNVVSLVKMTQMKTDVVSHVLWLGGDLFSGWIHEDLVPGSECSPTEAIVLLRKWITSGIQYLESSLDVPRIIVPCNFGNHGRTTMRPRIATAKECSYEWMLYQMLQEDFSKNKRVEFIVPEGEFTYLTLCPGYRIRFTHGDSVRYGGGIGGLSIPLNKRIAKWDEGIYANLTVLGHLHQAADFGRAIVNGSLIGYSEYALHIAASPEPAQQMFFAVDLERRQKTIVCPIHVT